MLLALNMNKAQIIWCGWLKHSSTNCNEWNVKLQRKFKTPWMMFKRHFKLNRKRCLKRSNKLKTISFVYVHLSQMNKPFKLKITIKLKNLKEKSLHVKRSLAILKRIVSQLKWEQKLKLVKKKQINWTLK